MPLLLALINPELLTVTICGDDADQVTAVFVASGCKTVAITVLIPLTGKDKVDLLTIILVTFTTGIITEQDAVLDPSAVLTVTTEFPAFIAVTRPVELTVTFLLFESQVTALLKALAGKTVAANCNVDSLFKVADVGTMETEVTDILGATVTIDVLDLFEPSTVVAVIIAVPAATPVTSPPKTVATLVLLELQVRPLLVVVMGNTEAVISDGWLAIIDIVVLSNDTPDASILAKAGLTTRATKSPFIEPNPVHKSYPKTAANAPLEPDLISLKLPDDRYR